jgi:hypothetical protein
MLIFTPLARLDRKVKELAQEKEELLKNTKVQAATMESVKVQIEALLKVVPHLPSASDPLLIHDRSPRPRPKSARRSRSSFQQLQIHLKARLCRANMPFPVSHLPHLSALYLPTLIVLVHRMAPQPRCADSNEFDEYYYLQPKTKEGTEMITQTGQGYPEDATMNWEVNGM